MPRARSRWGSPRAPRCSPHRSTLFGPPGAFARGDLEGVTALHVAITAGAAAFGAILGVAGRASGRRTTSAAADDKGIVVLRVPYATGMNGAVDAGATFVQAGTRTVPVTVSERDVVSGGRVSVSL